MIAGNTIGDLVELRRLLFASRKRRSEAIRLLLLMLVSALTEFALILAIVPFLACLADPARAASLIPAGLARSLILWSADPIAAVSLLVGVVALLSAAVRLFLLRASQRFVFDVGLDLSSSTYRAVLHQPLAFHLALNSSAVLVAIQSATTVTGGFLLPAMQASVAIVLSFFIVAAMALVSPVVALSLVAIAVTSYVAIALLLRKRLRRSGEAIALAQAARLKLVQEGMGGIRDVLIGGAQRPYLAAYERQNELLRANLVRASFAATAPRGLVESAGILLIAALAIAMARTTGGLSGALPTLGALALGAQKLLPLFGQIFNGWAQTKSNRASLQEVLAYHRLTPPLPAGADLPFLHQVELRSAGFAYEGSGAYFLRGVDLTIPKGVTLGIVGRTGIGKSTLLDLVLGLLQPTEGGLFVDGREVTAANAAAWRRHVAHVPQTIYLADLSIAENIAFGIERDAIDPARLRDAAMRAGLDQFVRTLPDGLDSRVGERGVRLSGGQRQRIGIARALYRRASLLVLDEPTSALDTETEDALLRAIADLPERPTILITAHRSTVLRHCARVYRIVDGGLVEHRVA